MKTKIEKSEITCDVIKQDVEICEKEILNFVNILKKYIKIPDSENIDKENILTKNSLYRFFTKEESNQYRENNKVQGNSYQFIWAFSLDGKEINIPSMIYFEENWIENTIYFVLEANEYLDNNSFTGSRFLEVFINGFQYSEDGTYEEHSIRLAHNNNNYELTSCLNKNVARKAIIKINQVMEEFVLLNNLEKEFKDR